jgi:tetratricopeptide (TPR) repeat protein
MSLSRTPEVTDWPAETPSEIRREMLESARRYAPAGFDVETFWEHLIEHLRVSALDRLLLLNDFCEGNMAPRKLLELQQEVEEARSAWDTMLGVEMADLLRPKLARGVLDPYDTEEVLAQISGDPDEDAGLLLYAFWLEFLREKDDLSLEEGEARLRQAAALHPRRASLWVALARGLEQLALARPPGERRKALFLDAHAWLDEALRRQPSLPEALLARGKVLAEIASLSGEAEQAALLDQSRQCFAEAAQSESVGMEGAAGQGMLTWWMAFGDEGEKPSEDLREAQGLLRQAFERGARHAALRMSLGQIALDLAWRPGAAEERRALFEEACGHFKACSEDDSVADKWADEWPEEELLQHDAVTRWGAAVVGLAALSAKDDRKGFIQQAAELFDRAVRLVSDPAGPHRAAACSWLQLCRESEGGDRGGAARRALDAARQLNRLQPGEGDYNLACALSYLGQHAEAAGCLTSALEHEPTLASSSLTDPDLESLWEARPQLRKRIAARGASGLPSPHG